MTAGKTRCADPQFDTQSESRASDAARGEYDATWVGASAFPDAATVPASVVIARRWPYRRRWRTMRGAMLAGVRIVALLPLIAGAGIACAVEPATVPAGVLILHSNQRATPAQLVIEDTLRATVAEQAGQPVPIYAEYLDDEWVSVETYGAKEAEFFRDKYGRRNIRVIVADGAAALRFAARFRDRIADSVPVVHIAVAPDRVDRAILVPGILGNFEDNDPTPTVRLALRLHPGATRFVFVRGAGAFAQLWEERFRRAAAQLPPMQVDYYSGLPTAELLRQVGDLPRESIVFTPGYFTDGAGAVTTPRRSVELIAAAAKVPVYGAFDTSVGAGVVGGYFTRYEDQARAAGGIVVRLLAGTPPAQIASSTIERVPIVDWRQLRRFGIDERMLPPGTIVRFRDASMWEQYRLEISVALAALILQAVMIASLLLQRRRRRRAEHASNTLAGQLITAHEDERRRLARDLHDDVTQRLARLAIDAGRIEQATGGGVARTVREDLVKLSEDVHALAYQLHPSVLDDLGLVEGIKAECDRLSRNAAIPVRVETSDVPPKVPREASLCLFRVAQEALRNVVRHARAQAIAVSLSAKAHGLELVVRDDGQGFDVDGKAGHASLGQVSMRERIRLQNGRLRVESVPGKGTTVTAWIPLEGAAP